MNLAPADIRLADSAPLFSVEEWRSRPTHDCLSNFDRARQDVDVDFKRVHYEDAVLRLRRRLFSLPTARHVRNVAGAERDVGDYRLKPHAA